MDMYRLDTRIVQHLAEKLIAYRPAVAPQGSAVALGHKIAGFAEEAAADWLRAQEEVRETVGTETGDPRSGGTLTLGPPAIDPSGSGELSGLQAGLDSVSRRAFEAGMIGRWRGERFAVRAGWSDPELATIDRGACPFFGFPSFGVHVNGVTQREGEAHLWLGRRAADAALYPGRLDNMVAGGIPAGLSARETLEKEAEEEAGIGPSLAARAQPANAIRYTMAEQPVGLKRDVLLVFDLLVGPDFIPVNQDGEVGDFECVPVAEAARLVAETDAFKPNCNFVVIDFLMRHGWIEPDQPGFTAIREGFARLDRDFAEPGTA